MAVCMQCWRHQMSAYLMRVTLACSYLGTARDWRSVRGMHLFLLRHSVLGSEPESISVFW